MSTALRTDVGRVRQINEDRAAVRSDHNGITLALLADGMGGHQAGDVASQTTIEVLTRELAHIHPEMNDEQWEDALDLALGKANAEIFSQSSAHEHLSGMGTTVVAALAAGNRLSVAHVGDSRAYLVHQEKLSLLTEDHSLVNELLRSGYISAEEASAHPRRNVVTRALGTDETVEADVRHWSWEPGDILLLCTDGLTDMVDEAVILHTLNDNHGLQWKADRLVELALEAGGDDNVTAVLVQNEPWPARGGEAN